MGEAWFYHLTDSPIEVTLPVLLERALGQGWRVAVRAAAPERLRWLDEMLWLNPKDGFLPHGIAGGPFDAEQPVLLTTGAALNGATCLMSIDGAPIDAAEVATLTRACILFDGNDTPAVEIARAQWRSLTGAGIRAQYWAEADGRWLKKAES